MSIWDVLTAARRAWWVMVIGVGVTMLFGVLVTHANGVYWASVKAVLVPVTTDVNRIAQPGDTLIPLAGVLERRMNEGTEVVPATASDVTIIDQGIYDGSTVRIPDTGGQWAHNFTEPALVIQAAASSEKGVAQRMSALLQRLEHQLDDLQNAAGVAPANRVTIEPSTLQYSVQLARGHSGRAAAVTIGLGIGLTTGAAVAVDRVRRGRASAASPI